MNCKRNPWRLSLILIFATLAVVSSAMADEPVTLESIHREMLELKAEIQGLRQEMREGGRFKSHRLKGTNDVDHVRSDKRPPKDPEARKAWYAERRKIHKARMKALREKHAEKGAQPVSTEQNNK